MALARKVIMLDYEIHSSAYIWAIGLVLTTLSVGSEIGSEQFAVMIASEQGVVL